MLLRCGREHVSQEMKFVAEKQSPRIYITVFLNKNLKHFEYVCLEKQEMLAAGIDDHDSDKNGIQIGVTVVAFTLG